MYKDQARQREANKRASKRYRAKFKGMTPEGMTRRDTVIPTQSHNPLMVGYVPPKKHAFIQKGLRAGGGGGRGRETMIIKTGCSYIYNILSQKI
jgi:hypothetical protein